MKVVFVILYLLCLLAPAPVLAAGTANPPCTTEPLTVAEKSVAVHCGSKMIAVCTKRTGDLHCIMEDQAVYEHECSRSVVSCAQEYVCREFCP